MTRQLILNFETDELHGAFVGWFLDGGGEQNFFQTCDDAGATTPGKFVRTSWKDADKQIDIILEQED